VVECLMKGDAIGYPAGLLCVAAMVCILGYLKSQKCSNGKEVDLHASHVLPAVGQVDWCVLGLVGKGCIPMQSS